MFFHKKYAKEFKAYGNRKLRDNPPQFIRHVLRQIVRHEMAQLNEDEVKKDLQAIVESNLPYFTQPVNMFAFVLNLPDPPETEDQLLIEASKHINFGDVFYRDKENNICFKEECIRKFGLSVSPKLKNNYAKDIKKALLQMIITNQLAQSSLPEALQPTLKEAISFLLPNIKIDPHTFKPKLGPDFIADLSVNHILLHYLSEDYKKHLFDKNRTLSHYKILCMLKSIVLPENVYYLSNLQTDLNRLAFYGKSIKEPNEVYAQIKTKDDMRRFIQQYSVSRLVDAKNYQEKYHLLESQYHRLFYDIVYDEGALYPTEDVKKNTNFLPFSHPQHPLNATQIRHLDEVRSLFLDEVQALIIECGNTQLLDHIEKNVRSNSWHFINFTNTEYQWRKTPQHQQLIRLIDSHRSIKTQYNLLKAQYEKNFHRIIRDEDALSATPKNHYFFSSKPPRTDAQLEKLNTLKIQFSQDVQALINRFDNQESLDYVEQSIAASSHFMNVKTTQADTAQQQLMDFIASKRLSFIKDKAPPASLN